MRSWRPAWPGAPCSALASAGCSVWATSDDLPLPETPVTQVNSPRGSARQVLQVVLPGAQHRQPVAIDGPAARPLGECTQQLAAQIAAGERRGMAMTSSGVPGGHHPARPARRRPGPDRRSSRRCASSPRRARPPARCCPCRAAAPACPAGGGCRAGAGRCWARRGHRARPPARSRSGWPGGCAAPRRRRGWAPGGRGSNSAGRRSSGTRAARISLRTSSAISMPLAHGDGGALGAQPQPTAGGAGLLAHKGAQ
jgi:hypothetical protein